MSSISDDCFVYTPDNIRRQTTSAAHEHRDARASPNRYKRRPGRAKSGEAEFLRLLFIPIVCGAAAGCIPMTRSMSPESVVKLAAVVLL